MTTNTCEFCKTTYPEEDETEIYYFVNVFNKDHILCGSCKKRLRRKKKKEQS